MGILKKGRARMIGEPKKGLISISKAGQIGRTIYDWVITKKVMDEL